MSMIRAIINWERCYELADPINGTANDKAKLLNNDKIYAARNEALKALEDHMETLHNTPGEFIKISRKNCEIAKNKCLDCNYENPKIAKYLRSESKIE